MKTGLHPEYHKVRITCVCGNTFETYSTKKEPYTVELCSACHPFYTGKMKLVDMAGRVEKFQKKAKQAAQVREEIKAREEARALAKEARLAKRKAQLIEKAETARKSRTQSTKKPQQPKKETAPAAPPPAEASSSSETNA